MVKLHFDFAKEGDYVNQVFKDNKKRDAAACWTLVCKDEPSKQGDLYFKMDAFAQSYCFKDLGDDNSVFQAKTHLCNPYAKAKIRDDGRCDCAFPYMGGQCEDCHSTHTIQKIETEVDGRLETHTVCVPNSDSNEYECNGNGKYNTSTGRCDCHRDYAGLYCEMCSDPDYEYPECGDEYESLFMESSVFDAFNKQRRE